MTIRSPGCASNLLFIVAAAASKAASARPFWFCRGLGSSRPLTELALFTLLALLCFGECVGVGCCGDTRLAARPRSLFRGLTRLAGEADLSLSLSATPRRHERAGEGDGERPCLAVVLF